MPLHDDEMKKRREKREAQRKKQQAEARRLRLALIAAAAILVLCGVGIFRLTQGVDRPVKQETPVIRETEAPTEEAPKTTPMEEPITTIHIRAAGDLNVTNSVVESGLSANGFDFNRLNMLIAVLEKRGGYYFNNCDAYINIVGGMKLDEPALDLTIAMALVSSLKDYALRDDVLAFGEIGLAGEIRTVNNCEQRIRECERLGFKKCIIPRQNIKNLSKNDFKDIEIIGVRNVREAFESAVE
jgi:predicted ATP-dependent serine protease